MAIVVDFFRNRSPFRRRSCELPPDLAPCNYGMCRPNEAFTNIPKHGREASWARAPTPTPPVVISSYSTPVQVPIIAIPKPRRQQQQLSQKKPKITLVELFQSQGCSSCPPANANVIELANNYPSILLLTYQVTYWDEIGWPDTFAHKASDKRQAAYAQAAGRSSVFTPQVLVNGRADGTGSSFGDLTKVVSKGVVAAANEDLAHVETEGNSIIITGGFMATVADVLLVRYIPNPRDVDVKWGENIGKRIPHRNVVKDIKKIGEWSGGSIVLNIGEEKEAGMERAVLLQSGRGGPVIGVAKFS